MSPPTKTQQDRSHPKTALAVRRRCSQLLKVSRRHDLSGDVRLARPDPQGLLYLKGAEAEVLSGAVLACLDNTRGRRYFFISGIILESGVAGPAVRRSFAAFGSLSAFASNRLTCHICAVERLLPKPGIPVIRMPPATFQ
jgi:hypothetical protein